MPWEASQFWGGQLVGFATSRLKHVEVRLLAIQSWVSTGRLRLQKVLTADNVADVVNKARLADHVGNTVHGFGSEGNCLK